MHPPEDVKRAVAFPLDEARRGFSGKVVSMQTDRIVSALSETELERRLLELGFVEGAAVEVLHEGAFGRDPIAVRIESATVALRRREARAVIVEADGSE